MKKIIILLLIVFSCTSCKTSNHIIVKKRNVIKKGVTQPSINETAITTDLDINTTKTYSIENDEPRVLNIVDYAKQFNGVKYKFGGATADGMDCSGLVFESFRAFNILLPRSSRDMARKGVEIPLTNTQEGDLLFFKTRNKRNEINHVGLVVTSNNGIIEFIHATLSAGVTVSKISENYWNSAFVEARRIL
jgi:cell wall-associated NlpC family hydrolase